MLYRELVQYVNGITISYLYYFTGAIEVIGNSQDREAAGKEDYVSHESIILRPGNIGLVPNADIRIGNIDSNLEANQRHNISLVGLEPRQCRSHLRPN